jgi:translocator protein
MATRSTRALVLSLAASALTAVAGGVGSRNAPKVYRQLQKPQWAPPAGVFGPAWSVLYPLIGVAGGRLAVAPQPRVPLALHGVQLALNAAWSPLFFQAHRRRVALAVVLGMDAVVAAEIVAALRRDRPAAALLAPYLAWILYATALNAAVRDPHERS